MKSDNGSDINRLYAEVDQGEDGALDRLVAAIYPELKRLAHFQLQGQRPDHTLNTTAIVHEAFVRMVPGDGKWNDRVHFLRAASRAMRHLLVDHSRKRSAKKRGAGVAPLVFKEHLYSSGDDSMAVVALDIALKDMAEVDPRLEQVIECRFFAGLSVKETAEALGMAVRTVERDCQRARGYLRIAMETDAQ